MLQSNLKEKFFWYSLVDLWYKRYEYCTKTVILLNLFCEVVKNTF